MIFKSLRVPERLFAVAMWAISFVFAGFLIGLGSNVIADLPRVDTTITQESFMDPAVVRAARVRSDSLTAIVDQRTEARERAGLIAQSAENAYTNERSAFDNWIRTRVATTDPRQDPEVIRRTVRLDSLSAAKRAADRTNEEIDEAILQARQSLDAEATAEAQRLENVRSRYERALFEQELRVFGLRLLLTVPLLVIAGWLVLKKRKSEYWPLARGFVIFALFAFFFELVPYLPSYGGYVRYGVGIVLTLVIARYAVRAMRAYLARVRVIEKQSETERRRSLDTDTALKRMSAGACPACERPIAGAASALNQPSAQQAPNAQSNFCVFCGLRLYDHCPSCTTRKNAFFPFCPTCGVTTDAAETLADASELVPAGSGAGAMGNAGITALTDRPNPT